MINFLFYKKKKPKALDFRAYSSAPYVESDKKQYNQVLVRFGKVVQKAFIDVGYEYPTFIFTKAQRELAAKLKK